MSNNKTKLSVSTYNMDYVPKPMHFKASASMAARLLSENIRWRADGKPIFPNILIWDKTFNIGDTKHGVAHPYGSDDPIFPASRYIFVSVKNAEAEIIESSKEFLSPGEIEEEFNLYTGAYALWSTDKPQSQNGMTRGKASHFFKTKRYENVQYTNEYASVIDLDKPIVDHGPGWFMRLPVREEVTAILPNPKFGVHHETFDGRQYIIVRRNMDDLDYPIHQMIYQLKNA